MLVGHVDEEPRWAVERAPRATDAALDHELVVDHASAGSPSRVPGVFPPWFGLLAAVDRKITCDERIARPRFRALLPR